VENTVYTFLTVVGHPPKWARAIRHRRAIRWNGLLVAALVVVAVEAMRLNAAVTLEVWLVPAGIAVCLLLPLLLLPEHYGATGEGDVASNTRAVRSNPLLRWFFWNTNYHSAHHLAPSVPFNRIEEVDALLEAAHLDPKWRVRSYTAFHVGNLTRLAFNRPPVATTGPATVETT
jgi:fatty acid desaturase